MNTSTSPIAQRFDVIKSIVLPCLGIVLLWGALRLMNNPSYHRARAREFAEQSYRIAQTGGEQYPRHVWEELQEKYGRVVRFQVKGERFVLIGKREYMFEVLTVRERATNLELIQIGAGNNSVHGEYAHVSDITVEKSAPQAGVTAR